MEYLLERKMLAAPGVRIKSPMNLLTGPESAYLRWADENRSFQTGMAASRREGIVLIFIRATRYHSTVKSSFSSRKPKEKFENPNLSSRTLATKKFRESNKTELKSHWRQLLTLCYLHFSLFHKFRKFWFSILKKSNANLTPIYDILRWKYVALLENIIKISWYVGPWEGRLDKIFTSA